MCWLYIPADCPQGTYYLDNKCEPCEFGMYQDEIAQVKCKTCPDSYTTDYRGAKLKTECDGIVSLVYETSWFSVLRKMLLYLFGCVPAGCNLCIIVNSRLLFYKKYRGNKLPRILKLFNYMCYI